MLSALAVPWPHSAIDTGLHSEAQRGSSAPKAGPLNIAFASSKLWRRAQERLVTAGRIEPTWEQGDAATASGANLRIESECAS